MFQDRPAGEDARCSLAYDKVLVRYQTRALTRVLKLYGTPACRHDCFYSCMLTDEQWHIIHRRILLVR